MSNQAQEYKPQFPEAYEFLLDTYGHLMKSRSGSEIAVWTARFQEFMHTLRALKEGGAFSPEFSKNFHKDVEAVIAKVHRGLDKKKLTDKQRNMAFGCGIKNLAGMFGGMIPQDLSEQETEAWFDKLNRSGSGARYLADAHRTHPPELGERMGTYDPLT
jgi:hypothetical protein